GGGQGVRRVAPFVLEEMAQVFVARQAKQPAATAEEGRQLEIGEIGSAMRIQPILLFGESVMRNPGTMPTAQRGCGRTEKGGVAVRLGNMQRYAVDPAAYQELPSGKKQRRRDPKNAGNCQRAAFAPE